MEVEHTTDPNDPTLETAIHQQGYVTFQTQSLLGGGTQDNLRHFDNRYWMSQEGGRYQIADVSQSLANVSALDEFWGSGGWWRLVLALLIAGVATVRVARRLPPAAVREATKPAVAQPVPGGVENATQAPSDRRVRVQTFGALHLWADGKDLASELLARRVLAFMWLCLFGRAINDPDSHITRGLFGEEMFPRIAPGDQRKRVRDNLGNMRKEMPGQLSAAVKSDGDLVSFDLSGFQVDAVDLLSLARSVQAGEKLNGARLGQAQSLVIASAGLFIPVWDELVSMEVGRDSMKEFMAELRLRLENARVGLMVAIGTARLGAGENAAAVAPLKEANELRGDREDVARLLARAYRLSGQEARASELERTYGIA
jgi:hypothetical protein